MRPDHTTGGEARGGAWSTRDVVLGGVFAALTAVGAQVETPLPFSPVPVVLSNFFAVLAGLTLGARLGAMSQVAYALAGVAGLPVFAGLRGGGAVLAGPTGGYLVGFVLAAAVAGALRGPLPIGSRRAAWAAAAAAAVIYVPGVPWLAATTGMSAHRAFFVGVLPFLPGDALKTVAAAIVAPSLARVAATRTGRLAL
ncbi:MAG TPA: biotin transporter BioY [bacterium]|nr:biotin transporter BioY [bacterium]